MIEPIDSSELAEIVPTWAIALLSLQGLDIACKDLVIAATALSIPRFRSIGFIPAATALWPSTKIERANTVAVVVPSPAVSEVLDATSLTICAPIFLKRSSNSISFATDTPSLVTVGAPKDLSNTTLRPRGPIVTSTASANALTPANNC